MNYYPRHIGDYAAATRHLSILEHGVYTLLLDAYYVAERPLPASEREVCRLLAARSKEEREAVGQILREFFELTDAGWAHARCDAEIAKFQEKSTKSSNAAKKRWNQPTHSERNADAYANAPPNAMRTHMPTHSERNANQEPITNNQKNLPPPSQPPAEALEADAARGGSDSGEADPVPPTPHGALSRELRQLGVTCMPNNPELQAWVAEGFTVAELTAAVEIVRQTKPRPQPIPTRYLDTTVRRLRAEAEAPPTAKPPRDDWHRTPAGVDRKARELGMFAHGGEDYPAFTARIWAEVKRRQNAQPPAPPEAA